MKRTGPQSAARWTLSLRARRRLSALLAAAALLALAAVAWATSGGGGECPELPADAGGDDLERLRTADVPERCRRRAPSPGFLYWFTKVVSSPEHRLRDRRKAEAAGGGSMDGQRDGSGAPGELEQERERAPEAPPEPPPGPPPDPPPAKRRGPDPEDILRPIVAELRGRQERDLRADERYFLETLPADRRRFDRDMEEFTYRKRKHDAAMEAWREKQKAEGPEAAGAQPPRLDVAPPMAPLSVNDTVVGALLERFRDVAAGKYRFEPGHAIAIFGLPRSGSTVLFNMVRLLVRDVDPNVVSGFSVPFDKILEWKKVSVSVVTKLHELAKPKKLESGEEDLEGFYREHEVLDGVVFSHRNPGGLVCSWCHLLGDEKCRPPKDEDEKSAKLSIFKASTRQKCRRIMSIQNNLYRNLYPLVLYDFNYETEIAARPTSPNGTAVFDPVGNADHRRVLSTLAHLRLLLGLDDRVDDWTLVKLAREMVMIRAVSIPVKGKHPADWEHPTTLMHHNHVSAYAPGQDLAGVSNALVPSKIAKEDCKEIGKALTLDRNCNIWMTRNGRWIGV